MSPRVAQEKVAAHNDPKVQALVSEFMKEKKREIAAASEVKRTGAGRHILMAILASVCVAAWVAPYPTVAVIARPDPKVERASTRMTLFLAAQSVTHFRVTSGRLPSSLREAGIDRPLIHYTPGLDGSFTLSARVGEQTVSYDSSVPLQSFLGGAEEVISQTGH